MKILVFGNADMKPGFIRAGNQHGHHVLYTDRLPSVDEALSFSPDAVILMIQRPASLIQDCLAAIYHACTAFFCCLNSTRTVSAALWKPHSGTTGSMIFSSPQPKENMWCHCNIPIRAGRIVFRTPSVIWSEGKP